MERMYAICVIGLALLIGGCAHSSSKFYWPTGELCAKTSSFVIGTGEAEKYVVMVPCGVTEMYDTKDTGISDNFTEFGGEVAEGLAEGAMKGVMPTP